ncbi:unnamed protein product, partial [Amoebophrya sp. A120]
DNNKPASAAADKYGKDKLPISRLTKQEYYKRFVPTAVEGFPTSEEATEPPEPQLDEGAPELIAIRDDVEKPFHPRFARAYPQVAVAEDERPRKEEEERGHQNEDGKTSTSGAFLQQQKLDLEVGQKKRTTSKPAASKRKPHFVGNNVVDPRTILIRRGKRDG